MPRLLKQPPTRHIVRSAHDVSTLRASFARLDPTASREEGSSTPTPPRSRRTIRASFGCEAHLKFRGRRECRALDAPAASRAKIKSTRA